MIDLYVETNTITITTEKEATICVLLFPDNQPIQNVLYEGWIYSNSMVDGMICNRGSFHVFAESTSSLLDKSSYLPLGPYLSSNNPKSRKSHKMIFTKLMTLSYLFKQTMDAHSNYSCNFASTFCSNSSFATNSSSIGINFSSNSFCNLAVCEFINTIKAASSFFASATSSGYYSLHYVFSSYLLKKLVKHFLQ